MAYKDNDVLSISDQLLKPREVATSADETVFPAAPCSIRVTIDQLSPYDGNPRQSINPLYNEIKESIRCRGLDHPPNITARPESNNYMIKDGGNTRLQILRELWGETKDLKFYEFECKFHPWKDELDTLAGHMIENELRGSMTLIDRALAAIRMRDLILEKMGKKSISLRKLAACISESGWSTNDSNLSVLIYAAETLLPDLPEALLGGMGRPAVKSIRKLHDCAAKYAGHIGVDKPRFEELWREALRKSDAPNFSYPDLFVTISNRFRQEKQIDGIALVEVELDILLKGGTLTKQQRLDADLPENMDSGLGVSGSSQPVVPSLQTKAQPVKSAPSNNSQSIQTIHKQEKIAIAQDHDPSPQERERDAVRRDISDRARWIATNAEIEKFVSITTDGAGFKVNLTATYSPVKDYINIQAGVIALLAQFQSSCLDYPAEQIGDLPLNICQMLFHGDWKRMVFTLHQVTHVMRNDPEIVKDGLYKLYEIEPLIFELNTSLQGDERFKTRDTAAAG